MASPVAVLLILVGAVATSALADSCSGRCSNYDTNSYTCQCSKECIPNGNCCSDYVDFCDSLATCVGRNCYGDDQSLPCQCNQYCSQYGDCCPDYEAICVGSCQGRCGPGTDTSANCQCNSYCEQYGDCCSDYYDVCSSTPDPGSQTSCAKQSVSNAELKSISYELWNLDENSASESDITVDPQGSTSQGSVVDVAPNPFFVYVNEAVLQRDTFVKLRAIQDNYIRNQGNTEVVTNQELAENDDFLNAFLATNVGDRLYTFLNDKGLAGCAGMDGFKTILDDIWFGMYDRQAPDDTSGFEHSFVGEIKGSGVSGFHNWVHFYEEEKRGDFNYLGQLSYSEPRLYGMTHLWFGADKPINGFTIGTSPEIEFALYTLCHLARPNSRCNISVGDSNGNAADASIQTYTWTKSYPPSGESYIASAYFIG